MQVPLELTFRGVEKTPALVRLINERVDKLEQICSNLISCHIAVEQPQKHQTSGDPYRVRIDMRLPPGHELVVKSQTGEGEMHRPLETALRDTFDSAERRLRKQVEQMQGDVKTHPDNQVQAVVDKIFPEEGYGFLRTLNGREVYFHRNSVLHDDFERLVVGTGVRLVEEPGEEGPQASTVQIVDKPDLGVHEP